MATIISLTSRPWAGPDDLRAMTGVVSATWASDRRPFVPCTAGDLEWWTAGAGPDANWPTRIRIWELGWADPVGSIGEFEPVGTLPRDCLPPSPG